jgi:hypothetical protein
MATDPFTDRLSDYADGDLDASERAALDAHLATCAECRTTLDELRAVMARAASLEATPPAQDLWAGIAARIGPAGGTARVSPFRRVFSARRFSFTLPQIAAACLAVMLLSGGLVWMARSGDPRADFDPVSGFELTPVSFADPHYDEAVADLQRTVEEGRTKLSPETIRVLEDNLATIDRAIDQCRHALSADPANVYLNTHLAETRQRKLALLRRASALATTGS